MYNVSKGYISKYYPYLWAEARIRPKSVSMSAYDYSLNCRTIMKIRSDGSISYTRFSEGKKPKRISLFTPDRHYECVKKDGKWRPKIEIDERILPSWSPKSAYNWAQMIINKIFNCARVQSCKIKYIGREEIPVFSHPIPFPLLTDSLKTPLHFR